MVLSLHPVPDHQGQQREARRLDPAAGRTGRRPDEHEDDHDQNRRIGQPADVHRVEPGGPWRDRLEEGIQELRRAGNPFQDVVRLEEIEENRLREDQAAGGQQNELRVEREPLLRPPEVGDDLMLDDEADPPEDDEPHHGQVDDPVSPVGDQAVGKEGIAAVVEGRHGVV